MKIEKPAIDGLGFARFFRALLVVMAFSGLLAACQSSTVGSVTDGLADIEPGLPELAQNPQGEVFGQGTVRVSLLIPKTASGNAASVANEIRNGALMAMQDFGQNDFQLVIKDTQALAAEAQIKANEAISEGSSLILGPLFSSSVSAASAVTQPAGRTMIAFSNDTSVGRKGVYLLSYTQQADTERMVDYAISRGIRSIHAFLPNSPVGSLQEVVLRQKGGAIGVNIAVSKYERSPAGIEAALSAAATNIAPQAAIYIPEGGQVPSVILAGLQRSGVTIKGRQLLGSGQWESVKLSNPTFEGALYTGRDIRNFSSFSTRYEQNYNAKPGVFAALGYDSITLVASLLRAKGTVEAFQPQTLENPRGFNGINGLFRFRSDGTAERGLAIYRVENGVGRVEAPAPSSFSGL